MNLEQILTIVSSVIGFLATTGITLFSIFAAKYKKEKVITDNSLNYIDIILEKLPELMIKYENIFTQKGSGEKKLAVVETELKQYCMDNNIKFNELLFQNAITSIIKISKELNK